MTQAALSVNGLTIRDRQGGAVVADISFAIPPGGALTVIGETGSGKSLIAQALFGLLPETMRAGGRISIAGAAPIDAADRRRLAELWRRQLMLIPQEPVAALDPVRRERRDCCRRGPAPGLGPDRSRCDHHWRGSRRTECGPHP